MSYIVSNRVTFGAVLRSVGVPVTRALAQSNPGRVSCTNNTNKEENDRSLLLINYHISQYTCYSPDTTTNVASSIISLCTMYVPERHAIEGCEDDVSNFKQLYTYMYGIFNRAVKQTWYTFQCVTHYRQLF